jgi:hypothetical protein
MEGSFKRQKMQSDENEIEFAGLGGGILDNYRAVVSR